MSLAQQTPSSDEQRQYISDAVHLLSYLHIRMGQVERALSECEGALQARRRFLGKRSDASLEPTAVMAHIYALLKNHARAKSWLAMIPEARRDTVVKIVKESLGMKMERLDSPSLLTQSISEDSDLTVKALQSRPSPSSLALPMQNRYFGPISASISQSPTSSLPQPPQCIPSIEVDLEDLQPVTATSLSSADMRSESRATQKESD
jgi:hypothetical protein